MKVLLPLDGSAHSLAAVRHAIRLVDDGLRASFVVANVQQPAHLYELMMADADTAAIARASAGAAASAMDSGRALLDQAEIGYEVEVATGEPVPMLIDIVERLGCDAVVMGARGLGDLRAALLGSVSHGLAHHATVPVTLVRDVAPDRDEPAAR